LLSRKVKEDRKGIFFYGGYRFRPMKKTLIHSGSMVDFESPFRRPDAFVKVFVDGLAETWRQTLVPTKHSIHYGKTIRLSDTHFPYSGLLSRMRIG
jgi:hypothetical protein